MSNPEYTHWTQQLEELRQLKAEYRKLDKQAKDAKDAHDALQHEVFEAMRLDDAVGHKTNSATFTRKTTIFANVNDLDSFSEWCRSRGLDEEFIKAAPEKQRLNEFVRAAIDNGEELPDGVSWYPREYISIEDKKA